MGERRAKVQPALRVTSTETRGAPLLVDGGLAWDSPRTIEWSEIETSRKKISIRAGKSSGKSRAELSFSSGSTAKWF